VKVTAPDLLELGFIDGILPEPTGGAHRDLTGMAGRIGEAIARTLDELDALPREELVRRRQERYLAMGAFSEDA
jgi:acetyl-CoA carboxylase carboxyl transferase subunit alpha